MSTLEPTPEQAAIVHAAKHTMDNLLIQAYAGTGKTSTMVMVAKAMPSTPVLALAFNKKIADEMATRFSGNVESRTLNSLGHRVWSQATGRRLVVDGSKARNILKRRLDELPPRKRDAAYESYADLIRLCELARLAGYIPPGLSQSEKSLCPVEDLFDEEDPPALHVDILNETLRRSIRASFEGQVDFTDQVYMPGLFGGTFPNYPLVIIDEAQDLSALNHYMLGRLARRRIIAVGDSRQSIYGFRGAVTSGMARLAERFAMREFPLATTFRCPRAVVELAAAHAPALQAAPGNPEGLVEYLDSWSADDVPEGAAIICRNNAPLMRAGLHLLAAGRPVKVHGKDIGPGLVKQLEKLGPKEMKRERIFDAIDAWEAKRSAEVKEGSRPGVADRAACLRVFAGRGQNLSQATAYASALFAQEGTIHLLTGHKSKGLEWDTVFHLEPGLIGRFAKTDEQEDQEANLSYVITTRSKRRLAHVTLEGMQ